jgi:hypothetical protein
LEAAIGIEPMNKGFADLCLTTWLRRHSARTKEKRRKDEVPSFQFAVLSPNRQFSGYNTENQKLKTNPSRFRLHS